jgi:uroporphyrinogen decarboxylase
MAEFTPILKPDADGLLANLRREGTPDRVHFLELFLDAEIKDAVCARFGLADDLDPADPHYARRREIALQRFLGYSHIYLGIRLEMPTNRLVADDTAELAKSGGRSYVDEHHGPITTWEEFEQYPWPDTDNVPDEALLWYEENLPEDMCLIPNVGAHFCEHLCWLFGYESLCYALFDQRDLVQAIADKLLGNVRAIMRRALQFSKVRAVWGSNDMGFKTQTLISPDDLREFVLPGHKEAVRMAHEAGRPYLLHACGKIQPIMADLIEDVGIDAKHSFEDTIESVIDAKRDYGDRLALIGGIDVDFLCRADEQAIRRRVRETLDACMPGGGYCLGSGNSVANYVPLGNYLAMMDEGHRYSA